MLNKCQKLGVTAIGINFCESASDIEYIKKIVGNKARGLDFIARIKTLRGLQNIQQIIQEAEGIQFCRGQLSMEMDFTNISFAFQHVLRLCKMN